MTSRITITALLAIGALMGSAVAASAKSALSTDTSAAAAQYGQAPNQVLPTLSPGGNGPGAGPGAGAPAAPRGGVAGVTADSPPRGGVAGVTADSPTAAAQAPRQLEADSLPFTGFAAIPLLLVGLALLACGLVLRRRTGRESGSLSAA